MRKSEFDATIYNREVADVCLNCPYPKCREAAVGCELFKDKWKQVSKRSGHKWRKPKLKEAV